MRTAPIGREPIELTTALVRLDADLRGVAVEDAWSDRAAAFEGVDALLAVWDGDVELTIELDGRWRPAIDAARASGTTWALLTAMNPFALPLSVEANERRNGLMAAELGMALRSVGRASDGSWEEAGFAVPFDTRAIDVAQRFAQAAIYRVTGDAVETVVLVGADPAELRRLGEPSSGT